MSQSLRQASLRPLQILLAASIGVIIGLNGSPVLAEQAVLSSNPSQIQSAWTQGPSAENVFAGLGNPAGLAFTPGLQLGLMHQISTGGNLQTIDLYSALKLDMLALGFGYYNNLAGVENSLKEQYRLASALDFGGSALGFNWNSRAANLGTVGLDGAWTLAGINRTNGWLAQSVTMSGASSSLNGFDDLSFGIAVRPLGQAWTVSAQVQSTDVWQSQNFDMSVHNWFQLGDFSLLASVSQMAFSPVLSPVYQLGLAYRGSHLGFGTSTLFANHFAEPVVATHARISSSAFTQSPGLMPEYISLTLTGDGRPGNSGDPMTAFFETPVNPDDILLQIDKAMKSDKVSGILIRLSNLQMGFGQALEWHRSMKHWRTLGKKIIIYLERPGDVAYFLATAADEIWLSPAGTLMVDGISITSLYFADALSEVGLEAQAIAAGQYKTAPRQFTGNGPSDEEVEVFNDLANQYYETLLLGLKNGRGFDAQRAEALLNQGGFSAQEALESKMVDRLIYPSDFDQGLKSVAGKTVWQSPWKMEVDPYRANWAQPKSIAVIPILGSIVNGYTNSDFFGNSDAGATGASTVIEAIEEAVARPDIVAIVLRVDSPGGDAMASDHIYHSVQKANTKKPVIVSMGNYAASGGYYVSAPAREIFAQPLTLTGSIGVFALAFNMEKTLDKLKIGRFDLKRGELQSPTLTRAMTEPEALRLQAHIDDTYSQFLNAVATGRKMKKEQVALIAEGRVWTGVQALEKGLVDKLGHFQDAIIAAASAAGLNPEQTAIELIILGRGDFPLKQGFQALIPTSEQQELSKLMFKKMGVSPSEMSFWLSDGTKAHLPYKLVVE